MLVPGGIPLIRVVASVRGSTRSSRRGPSVRADEEVAPRSNEDVESLPDPVHTPHDLARVGIYRGEHLAAVFARRGHPE